MTTTKKQLQANRRQSRVNSTTSSGTSKRPRISIKASLAGMFVQFIDDSKGATLVSGSDKGLKGTKTERATLLGGVIGKKAIEAGIKTAVFNRGPKQYHGRVKAFAEAIRKAGLTI